ncbi:glycosyltransferase [Arcticibacter tournemirensis]|uniref:glycosyltransferase n=1 Tax=Arcticibacter tournemirensis TaxID=699437 RepID=UPI0013873C48|nr:glycosyltransferase [Arcticibacter tournemirensis]
MRTEILKNSKGPIANANDSLQWAYLKGISDFHQDCRVISSPNIGAFPFKYRSPYFKGGEFDAGFVRYGRCVGFLNLVAIKHFSRFLNIRRVLHGWIKQTKGEMVIVVYDLHPPFLMAALLAKKSYPNAKICLIVPDLYDFTGNPKNLLYHFWGVFEKWMLNMCIPSVDAYVLISKHMKDRLPINKKPYIIIEGIYNPQKAEVVEVDKKAKDMKTVFYSGALNARNGILFLVKSFKLIKQDNYRLLICGDGESREEIKSEALKDKRIIYKGQVPRGEAMKLQRSSTLLVSPRLPDNEFTKYSFPSKIIEYLASGVPTLMYKLEGIPDEYYDHCYSLDDTSISSLADKIESICQQSKEVLSAKGRSAQKFVYQNKNPHVQVDKMVKMVYKLFEQ